MSHQRGGRADATDFSGVSADNLKEEIEKLAKKGSLTPQDIEELYKKYEKRDEIIDEILRLREKKIRQFKKLAKTLAQKVYNKYILGGETYHNVLKGMLKYKKDNNWTDTQYDEFRRELGKLLTGTQTSEIEVNQTAEGFRSRISRALGSTNVTIQSGLNVKDSENSVVAEILSMYSNSLELHRNTFIKSLMYTDLAPQAIYGKYDAREHVASDHIHPIFACLYLIKLDILEIHTLYSNIGGIVKARHEKKQIYTEPDALLFYDMTSDQNDVVCEPSSPIADIRNRYRVQISLWETVMRLREGKYYGCASNRELMKALHACRNNLYDSAEVSQHNDEGALIRRFLSVFSLRPTIIYTRPLVTMTAYAGLPTNGYNVSLSIDQTKAGLGNIPYVNQPSYTVTSIPLYTLQIPSFYDKTKTVEPINITSAVTQTIWISENQQILPKEQSIIYSKEILIFYVNRRIQQVRVKTYSNPLTFTQLPMTMSAFESVNKYPVNVPFALTLGKTSETYDLRSVVAVTETSVNYSNKVDNIITGCVGLLVKPRNIRSATEQSYYLYDPYSASVPVQHPDGGMTTNKPISSIPPYALPGETDSVNFAETASQLGTIYVYAKSSGYSINEYISI